jgi:hypothetical protein
MTKTFKQLGSAIVVYESDRYNGEYLDTKVRINDETICVIEGNKISEFNEKLEEIINTYRI